MMNIVHLITSLQRGGAEIALANLLAQLQQHTNQNHAVIFFHDGPVRHNIEQLGIPCYQVSAKGGYINPLFFIKLFIRIRRFMPDCLHTDLWAANLLGRICARLLGIPCVSVLHALTEHEGRLRRWIDRLLPISPTTYVAVSNSIQQSLITYHRYQQAPCTVILNGIDHTSVLQASNNRNSIPATLTSMTNEKFVIGTVGRLIRDKNYHILLESFAKVHAQYAHTHLIIVGSGPEKDYLKSLAKQLNISEEITWIMGKQSYPYYPFFDCYVQPSRYEGLSIALLEALCFSLPVIVTGHATQHEVIQHHKNGLVIEPDDVVLLTKSIRFYMENQASRVQFGKAGFTTVTQQFSMKTTAKQYQDLFNRVIL